MSTTFYSLGRKFQTVSLREVPMDDLEIAPQTSGVRADQRQAEVDVLVVDDEPIVAATLAAILAQSGLRTRIAYDGVTALQLGQKLRPRVLIADIAMPGMTGVELALQLIQDVPHCNVLLFSGHATLDDLAPAIAAGYDFPLFAKPVHPSEILKNVHRCLEATTVSSPAHYASSPLAEQFA